MVSYNEAKPIIQDKLGWRCEDVKMEEMAVAAIKKSLAKNDKNKFFKYIIVDLDEVSIIIERFGRSIKSLLPEGGILPSDVKMYATSSTPSEKQKQHCVRANFQYFVKPTKANMLDTFRPMFGQAPKDGATPEPQESKLSRQELASQLKDKQQSVENQIEEQVAQQSAKLAAQEKEALDKLMNDVKDLVKE